MLDSFLPYWTRESVESAKNWLEYEFKFFEYESRLDPSLICSTVKCQGQQRSITGNNGIRTGHGLKFSARAGPGFFIFSPDRAGPGPQARPTCSARGLKKGSSLAGKKI